MNSDEARIARLEQVFRELLRRIEQLELEVAEIKARSIAVPG
jgi:hypothetical protein